MDSQRSNYHATQRSTADFPILILGGGAAGLAALEALHDADLHTHSALIEPSAFSYNQRAWMQVGTQGDPKEQTRSPLGDRIPEGCRWIQDHVTEINPDRRSVTLSDGSTIGYKYLLVALGTNPNWDRIRNLKENLGNHGICSVYGYEQAERTWGPRDEVTADLTDWTGDTLTVYGLGSIGETIAERGSAFGMEVYGVKRDPEDYDGSLPR